MRKTWLRWIILGIILLFVGSVAAFLIWTGSPAGPMSEALAALESDASVTVSTQNDWWVFEPTATEVTVGFIFYPGGLVEPRSYAPFARDIAAAGYRVIIVPMPLNLAIFNANAADAVIAAYPQIERWAIGGHSLGGAMAARYAGSHRENIAGLALWASYPEGGNDLSDSGMAVVSVYGVLDGLASIDQVQSAQVLLPEDAEFVRIEGGNHAQFGWYGDQAGDQPAVISREEQQLQTVAATLAMLARVD